jgi:hypothetical protein
VVIATARLGPVLPEPNHQGGPKRQRSFSGVQIFWEELSRLDKTSGRAEDRRSGL